MQQLLDFLPILIFAAVFFLADIYAATAALMIAVTAQLAITKLIGKPISRELQLTFWASIVFGALTLWFRDDTFIKWKPTVVNWLFSAALLAGHFISGDNFLKRLLGQQLPAPDEVWTRLNFGWAFGFFLAGVLNLIVAYSFSLDFWVTYKLIGGFAITLTYLIITFVYLHRLGLLDELPDEATEPAAEPLVEKAQPLAAKKPGDR